MYIFGGFGGPGHHRRLNDLLKLDLQTRTLHILHAGDSANNGTPSRGAINRMVGSSNGSIVCSSKDGTNNNGSSGSYCANNSSSRIRNCSQPTSAAVQDETVLQGGKSIGLGKEDFMKAFTGSQQYLETAPGVVEQPQQPTDERGKARG